MNTIKLTVFGIVLTVLASGCGAPETPTRSVSPVPPKPSAPVPTASEMLAPDTSAGMTLKQYLSAVANKQYTATQNLYIPPPQETAGNVFYQLHREPAVLYLDDRTSVYTYSGKSLAVGREDGVIKVFGGGKCSRLLLPEGKPVKHLSWYPSSYLSAASAEDGKRAAVFDLRQCGEVYSPVFNATVSALAVSPHGSWLAVVDDLHRLWVGPAARGPMTKAANLRYEVLDLAFTPQEGLLMAVDEAGWVTIWAPLTKKNVDSVRIPFGPFKSASFAERFIDLVPEEGQPVRWDIVGKKVVNLDARPSPFELKNGVLRYRTFTNRLVKKVHLRPPNIAVRFSPGNNVFEVHDLDGTRRYYHEKNGEQTTGAVKADDWVSLGVQPDGTFAREDVRYALADRIFQRDHMRLNCRFIRGKGYYLWWDAATRPNEFNPRPGYLPERQTIARDENVKWIPIKESSDLI